MTKDGSKLSKRVACSNIKRFKLCEVNSNSVEMGSTIQFVESFLPFEIRNSNPNDNQSINKLDQFIDRIKVTLPDLKSRTTFE